MAENLKGRVAVITGAGSGIGKAAAQLFASEGANVICADLSGRQDGVAAEIGARALPLHADVTKEDDVRHMVARAEQAFGKLDILVNNAGYGGTNKPFHEHTSEEWEQFTQVNLRGVFYGMKYGVISMLKSGGGAIVNIASAAGLVGWKGISVYSATKGGVIMMTKSAALDYAKKNIRINAVCPGITWTGLSALMAGSADPPPGDPIVPGTPMHRWGLPREIAAAILFLASDSASFMTGAVVPVDGGFTIGFSGMAADKD
jgi:NAD(P)-dependent dehydrogenase (short-subunit alcohol dehydrogenase family)